MEKTGLKSGKKVLIKYHIGYQKLEKSTLISKSEHDSVTKAPKDV
jgi:hypothetical protein